jgi:hypothetical protein
MPPFQASLGSADEPHMAKRSLRGLLRKKHTATDKKAMTPQMRELMAAHTSQSGQRPGQVKPGH